MSNKNSILDAISAITESIRTEATETLSTQAAAKIHANMDIVDNSNFVTLGEKVDKDIALQNEAEERAEAERVYQEAIEQAENARNTAREEARIAYDAALNPQNEAEEMEEEPDEEGVQAPDPE